MKKLILLSIIALGSLMAHAAANTVFNGVFKLKVALDGDKLCYSYSLVKGADVEYTIYNDHFEVLKNFTIKGLYRDDEFENHYMYIKSVDTEYVDATKGLFTSDGKWCVIFSEYSDGEYAYYVYNEDGERLFELPLSLDYGSKEVGCIYLSNVTTGRPYYATYVNDYSSDSENNQLTIWSFGTSGAKAPEIVRTVPVYPNPLPQGAVLTVSLPEAADANTMFVVNDMNGRQVLRRRVHQGETEMTLSPRFSRGTYVYTVIYADGTSASGKLAAE